MPLPNITLEESFHALREFFASVGEFDHDAINFCATERKEQADIWHLKEVIVTDYEGYDYADKEDKLPSTIQN